MASVLSCPLDTVLVFESTVYLLYKVLFLLSKYCYLYLHITPIREN
jgi:hypothetical protein